MYNSLSDIVKKADSIYKKCGTNDPFKIAREQKVNVIMCDFERQKGAYNIIAGNRFIYLKSDLPEYMMKIVLWHELGHDALHRDTARKNHVFNEFNVFEMQNNRMEYEANVFAAQIALPDDEMLFYIKQGYDIQQISSAMYSDINLVSLKNDILIEQGHHFRKHEHINTFLK
ncbi:MAG: ImmA/IrrE family metallo-endopeptidase [Clostridia bacterium]